MKWAPPQVAAWKWVYLSFWRLFPWFIVIFAQFEANPCDEASFGLVEFSLVAKAFRLLCGLGSPNSPFVLKLRLSKTAYLSRDAGDSRQLSIDFSQRLRARLR